MSDIVEPRPPRKSNWVRTTYIVPYVLVVYVLSAGPLYWQIYDSFQPEGSAFLRGVYYPIVFACENNDYVSNFFHWYAQLWAFSK